MRPIIGIAVCGCSDHRQFVSDSYIEVIEKSGGVPVLLPVTNSAECISYYSILCDGVLFCGGNDIAPFLWSENLQTDRGSYDLKTDEFHLSLVYQIYISRTPLLAICRGMQVLNVALGGSLYQDLSLRKEYTLCHEQHTDKRSDPSHRVTFKYESKLYKIFGLHILSNSFHHQALNHLGMNLSISALTPDGVIEAVESDSHPFCIGVQWHPESMYDVSSSTRELFSAFIEASAQSHTIR